MLANLSSTSPVLEYFIVLKFPSLRYIYVKINKLLEMQNHRSHVITYLKLILFILSLYHVIAIICQCILTYELNNMEVDYTWQIKYSVENKPWYEKYIVALYYGSAITVI